MEGARDLLNPKNNGKGLVLFSCKFDNADAHLRTIGPEIWEQTSGSNSFYCITAN